MEGSMIGGLVASGFGGMVCVFGGGSGQGGSLSICEESAVPYPGIPVTTRPTRSRIGAHRDLLGINLLIVQLLVGEQTHDRL